MEDEIASMVAAPALGYKPPALLALEYRLRVEQDAERVKHWRETGSLSRAPLSEKSVVLSCPLALDVSWDDLADRVVAALENTGAFVHRVEGVIEVSRVYPRRGDNEFVAMAYKRRDGVSAGFRDALGSLVDPSELWVKRLVAVDDWALRYYEGGSAKDQPSKKKSSPESPSGPGLVEWSKPRGVMALGKGTQVRFRKKDAAEDFGSYSDSHIEDPDDEDAAPVYFRTTNCASSNNKAAREGFLRPPTDHLVEVSREGQAWLLCFEDAATLEAWRIAMERCSARSEAATTRLPRASYAARLAAATSLEENRRRERRLVVESDGDATFVCACALRAAVLLDDCKNRATVDGWVPCDTLPPAAHETFAVVQLAPSAVAELRRGLACLDAADKRVDRAALRVQVDARLDRLKKVIDLVRPSYAAAKLPVPNLPVLSPGYVAALLDGGGDDDDNTKTHQVEDNNNNINNNIADADDDDDSGIASRASSWAWAQHAVAVDEDQLHAGGARGRHHPQQQQQHAGRQMTTQALYEACRATRMAILARAATEAARILNEAAARTRVARRTASKRRVVDAAEAAAREGLRRLLRDLPEAVRAGAWIGVQGPSAELWRRVRDAATLRDAALAHLSVIRGRATPGQLWISDTALYFAPAAPMAAIGGFFTGLVTAATPETMVVRVGLDEITRVTRGPSPVPLKANALKVRATDADYTFTLNAAGASVSAVVELIGALLALRTTPPQKKKKQPPASTRPRPPGSEEGIAAPAVGSNEPLAPPEAPPRHPSHGAASHGGPPPPPAPRDDDDETDDDDFQDAKSGGDAESGGL